MILHELIAYDVLRLIWWGLLGLLLAGFAVADGYDLGTQMLLPFAGRTDLERRTVIQSISPIWEANQVWLILGGGAIFAAWPPLYAVSFSGFYLAIFLMLFALILRPVAFNFRDHDDNPAWQAMWDWALFISGFVPAVIAGVALGNVLQGVPFHIEHDMQIHYDGTLLQLLNPYALLCAAVSVAMLVTHGGAWIQYKTQGVVAQRASRWGMTAGFLTTALYALAGVLLAHTIPGYAVTSEVSTTAASSPLLKEVVAQEGAWFANYEAWPVLWLVPAVGLAGPVLAALFIMAKRPMLALVTNAVGIAGMITSVGVSLFPFILPSSASPDASLTVWDASSSHLTLFVMLVAMAIFMPLILVYSSWVFAVLRGKVDVESLEKGSDHGY